MEIKPDISFLWISPLVKLPIASTFSVNSNVFLQAFEGWGIFGMCWHKVLLLSSAVSSPTQKTAAGSGALPPSRGGTDTKQGSGFLRSHMVAALVSL